ncbi:DNA replication/repair protein RecF [Jatrophihabitans sp. DSM 45814]
MYVQHLSVADFRSWQRADVAFEPGTSILVGSNGQGKTNLLEAIGYLATLSSHRVASDAPLIRAGAEQAVVQAAVIESGRQLVLEIAITAGKANKAKLNRSPVPRARDILGGLRTVLFAPEDLAIVRGDPSERRRFLDDVLVQRTPRLAAVRADYERVLKQRAALLKTAGAARRAGASGDLRTLDVWDGHLADHGAQLLAARMELVDALRPYAEEAYGRIAPSMGREAGAVGESGSPLGLRYVSSVDTALPRDEGSIPEVSVLSAALLAELARMRPSEVERGVNLVGPHRDDLDLTLNGLPLRGYASHGESWSAALSLRLACFDLLSSDGAEPVLILDDVFAELDAARREQLAVIAEKAEQVLISSAVVDDVPERLTGGSGAMYDVADGEVRRVR